MKTTSLSSSLEIEDVAVSGLTIDDMFEIPYNAVEVVGWFAGMFRKTWWLCCILKSKDEIKMVRETEQTVELLS